MDNADKIAQRLVQFGMADVDEIAQAIRQAEARGLRLARDYAAVTYSAISNDKVYEFCEWCSRRAAALEKESE